jgi:hypothetical protein
MPDDLSIDPAAVYLAAPTMTSAAAFHLADAITREYLLHHRVCPVGWAPGGAVRVAAAADVRDLATQASVVRYVNLLMRDAYDAGTSDIHSWLKRYSRDELIEDGQLADQ